MPKLLDDVVDALWGEKRHDGKFQWHDVLTGGWINAIEGRNRWEQASNDTFEIGDLTSITGVVNALRGTDIDKLEGQINDFFGNIRNEGKETLNNWIEGIGGSGSTTVPDGTDEGIEGNVNAIPSWEEIQKNYWSEYDKRRQQDWERQDSAIRRQVDDMIAAGINPNIAGNMTGAESIAGSYGAQPNFAANEMELEKYLEELDLFIDEKLTVSESNKNKLNSLLTGILMFFITKR